MAFVFVALIPGIAVHQVVNKAVDLAVNRIDSELGVKIDKEVSASPDFLDFLGKAKQRAAEEIKGPKAWTFKTLREALLWLNRLFVLYLFFIAFWLWARYTARLFMGQNGNVRFSLKNHP